MADINLLDGSPESESLLRELSQDQSSLIPGPFADDTEAAAGGVPLHGVYHNFGILTIRLA